MNPEKFTSQLQMALSQAQSLALQNNNTMLDPAHVLQAMLEVQGSTLRSLISKTGGNLRTFESELTATLSKLSTSTGYTQIQPSNDLVKVLQVYRHFSQGMSWMLEIWRQWQQQYVHIDCLRDMSERGAIPAHQLPQ